MISNIRGMVKLSGDYAELMADLSVLVQAILDDGTLDVTDIMDAVTLGLEKKGVGIIRSLDELNDLMEEMSETMEQENQKETEQENESLSVVDEIFRDIFKNKGEKE